MDSVEFSGEGASDVSIFGIKCFFEGVFGLPQGFGFALVGFNIGCEVVELFLGIFGSTYTVESRFLSDIKLYNES